MRAGAEERERMALRRFAARHLDYVFWALLLAPTLPLMGLHWTALPSGIELILLSVVAWPICTGAWVIPEAILLAWLGTTPGKWLLGLRVRPSGAKEGVRITLRQALPRSLSVWAFGSAFATYPIAVVAYLRSYRAARGEDNRWEAQGCVVAVHAEPLAAFAAAACVVFQVLTLGLVLRTDERTQAEATVRREIYTNRKVHISWFEDRGIAFDRSEELELFWAEPASVHESTVAVDAGGSLLVAGGCLCGDLDLVIYGPKGDELAQDREPDTWPLLTLEPEVAGTYRIVARMASCLESSCMAGYQVLRSASRTPAVATGTGVVIDDAGTVLTAQHVIDDAEAVTVTLYDGTVAHASVVSTSLANDLALLELDRRPASFLPLAEPASAHTGDDVFAVGFPVSSWLGTDPKVTDGSITALSGFQGDSHQIQISTPIQPGNSGGPVVNLEGRVVGIVTSSAVEEAFKRDAGSQPQLVNWATKSEIAFALLHASRHRSTRRHEPWRASSKPEAVDRAIRSSVLIWAGPPDRIPRASDPASDAAAPSDSPPLPSDCRAHETCCRVCRRGQACGDSCIPRSSTCSKPPGCACDAWAVCGG